MPARRRRQEAVFFPRPAWRLAWLVALCLAACRGPGALDDAVVEPSAEKGLACVARLYDGNAFRDDYLRYEYPGEAIESPLVGYRLTYRMLDAYFIVQMIRQAGVPPGEAGLLFERADAVTAALVPRWRRQGIYNLRRNPAHGGIALDTYAILAVLRRDREMGRVVEAGLDGDGWLAADFYAGGEAFRRLADESWAARAVFVADPPAGLEAMRGICRRALEALGHERDPSARANLVIHALEGLKDLPPSVFEATGQQDPPLEEMLRALRQEARRLLRAEAIRSDTLTFANLVGALVLWHDRPAPAAVSDESLAPEIQELIRRQEDDGCWSVSLDSDDASGRVFATLRVVLALGRFHAAPGRHETTGEAGP